MRQLSPAALLLCRKVVIAEPSASATGGAVTAAASLQFHFTEPHLCLWDASLRCISARILACRAVAAMASALQEHNPDQCSRVLLRYDSHGRDKTRWHWPEAVASWSKRCWRALWRNGGLLCLLLYVHPVFFLLILLLLSFVDAQMVIVVWCWDDFILVLLPLHL